MVLVTSFQIGHPLEALVESLSLRITCAKTKLNKGPGRRRNESRPAFQQTGARLPVQNA